MTKTENYQLNQWDPEDRVTHTDFNADNAKLDVLLKAQADAVAAETQAWKDAVAVETQARQNAIAAEAQARQTADTAEAQARQELAAQVIKCGNCKIITGTYTGSGYYGSTWRNYLAFSPIPLLVIIQPVSAVNNLIRLVLVQGCTYAFGSMTSVGSTAIVSWSTTGVHWYSNSAPAQCNEAAEYRYVAFVAMDT